MCSRPAGRPPALPGLGPTGAGGNAHATSAADLLSLSLSASNGAISGSSLHPLTLGRSKTKVHAMVVQKAERALGCFTTNTAAGALEVK